MKKVTFFAAALITSSVAFAQSNSDTTNITGSGNAVAVDQAGSGNQSRTDIFGDGNGFGDAISIDQEGISNVSSIKVGNTTHTSNANYINVTQNTGSNTSDVTVVGNGNDIDIDQINGIDNLSTVVLKENGAGTFSNANTSVTVTQDGSANTLQATGVASSNNTFNADQIGDENYHRISFRGDANTISVEAIGNDNRGDWNIASSWPQSSDNNILDIYQNGNGNDATGKIDGDGNTVVTSQTGDNNTIGTSWYTRDGVVASGSANTFAVTQTGDYNESYSSASGSGNTITIDQDGVAASASEGNFIDIMVDGDANMADLAQDGTENYAKYTVDGNANLLDLSQTGSGHSSISDVMGNNNTVTVTQQD